MTPRLIDSFGEAACSPPYRVILSLPPLVLRRRRSSVAKEAVAAGLFLLLTEKESGRDEQSVKWSFFSLLR